MLKLEKKGTILQRDKKRTGNMIDKIGIDTLKTAVCGPIQH